MAYQSLHKLGLAASAARQGHAVVGASWFETPGNREARVREVDGRIIQFARQLDLSDAQQKQPGLWTQFKDFQNQWETWVENMSVADTWLPATAEWANRQEEQLERFRQAFNAGGVTSQGKPLDIGAGMAMTYVPPPKDETSPWVYVAGVLIAGVVLGAAVVLGKTLASKVSKLGDSS